MVLENENVDELAEEAYSKLKRVDGVAVSLKSFSCSESRRRVRNTEADDRLANLKPQF